MEYPRLSSSAHPRTVCSPGLRLLSWLNIAIQTTFPLALAFTPTIAGADEQHFLLSAQHTRVYTLGDGENAASVAKKYHLTLDQLRELNQLRTFAHGLNGLQPGDDVDVPVAEKGNKTASMTSGDDAAGKKDDEQAQKVAGYASQTAGILSGGADVATTMARGMATSEVSGTVQQWLSHFGTARVQLDADQHFSLKNSQFDLLMPLYDQGNNLMFTQGSLHRNDSRTQANLGTGLRHFTTTYMLGANLFGDYDLSRDHARAGAGMEYWRDFLRLAANGYMRLTGWKHSPDLTNYQERAANGWDIRAQAWMPSLPQLGGKLTYEQYYGKEVALFGVNNRQKDPRAITAGINYTPVPLVTLGAEQRQGKSGKNDSRLTLEMKYQFGVPWRSQVDPHAVAAMRTLTGGRYDLVERNNNIVLDYRKKETLRLHTADLITGHAGEQKSLGVSVTSTYGLARIDWDAAALTAAGGKVVQNGGDYALILPPYHGTTGASNTYTVSGVAVDTRGNRSDRSDTKVTVQAPEVKQQTSTFTPASSLLPADGKSVQVLTLTLRDANNQAVDRDVKDITLTNSALKSAAVSSLSRKSAGVYSVMVTAGTDSETVTLTPSVSGMTLPPARVAIGSTAPVPEGVGVIVNGFNFAKDSGVPTTGFMGAVFKLNLETVSASDYTWKSDASWVSVTNGVVKFTGEGTGEKVTITGTPINNVGRSIIYSFSLKGWYSTDTNLSDRQNWSEANSRCNSRPGYRLPTVAQISLHSGYVPITGRRIGGLLNEWGGLYTYNPDLDILTWTSDEIIRGGNGTHYEAALARPFITYDYDSMYSNAICRKAL